MQDQASQHFNVNREGSASEWEAYGSLQLHKEGKSIFFHGLVHGRSPMLQ